MSSAIRAARTLLDLESPDFRMLQAIELGMNTFSTVPLEEFEKYSGLNSREAEVRLKKLDKIDQSFKAKTRLAERNQRLDRWHKALTAKQSYYN